MLQRPPSRYKQGKQRMRAKVDITMTIIARVEEERLTDNGQVDEPEILTGDNLDNDYSTDDFDAGDRFTS
jgi:hypothetical protein